MFIQHYETFGPGGFGTWNLKDFLKANTLIYDLNPPTAPTRNGRVTVSGTAPGWLVPTQQVRPLPRDIFADTEGHLCVPFPFIHSTRFLSIFNEPSTGLMQARYRHRPAQLAGQEDSVS